MPADLPSDMCNGQGWRLIEEVVGNELKVLHASLEVRVVVRVFILVHSYGPSGSYGALTLLLLGLKLSKSGLDFGKARARVRVM